MKFRLTPERRVELEPVLSDLGRWVEELEELDLERYDPTHDRPAPVGLDQPDATAH